MDPNDLASLLGTRLPPSIAHDIVTQFVQIRQDVASKTFGRSAPGKFVETVVQALQYLERGAFDAHPKVDDYLRTIDTRASNLPDGLRTCTSRICRSMYTLRNKRNIAHKGEVDPNEYDLRFLVAASQWVLAEFVREFGSTTMQRAGNLVAQVQAPVGTLVEDFGTRRLVYGVSSTKDEILVLLQSHYPSEVTEGAIITSLDRRTERAVKDGIRHLWKQKLLEGSTKQGYRLTLPGLEVTGDLIRRVTERKQQTR
jgi:hypothetical protein